MAARHGHVVRHEEEAHGGGVLAEAALPGGALQEVAGDGLVHREQRGPHGGVRGRHGGEHEPAGLARVQQGRGPVGASHVHHARGKGLEAQPEALGHVEQSLLVHEALGASDERAVEGDDVLVPRGALLLEPGEQGPGLAEVGERRGGAGDLPGELSGELDDGALGVGQHLLGLEHELLGRGVEAEHVSQPPAVLLVAEHDAGARAGPHALLEEAVVCGEGRAGRVGRVLEVPGLGLGERDLVRFGQGGQVLVVADDDGELVVGEVLEHVRVGCFTRGQPLGEQLLLLAQEGGDARGPAGDGGPVPGRLGLADLVLEHRVPGRWTAPGCAGGRAGTRRRGRGSG